ncbi:MAG: hypothetical protein RIB47_00270 [Cyclobacteriaceae bacterium]
MTDIDEKEVDIDAIWSEIDQAIEKNRLDELEVVLKSWDFDINFYRESSGETVLMKVIRSRRYEMVPLLVKYGADPDLVIGEFLDIKSPLLEALKNDDLQMLQVLKQVKADITPTYAAFFVNVKNTDVVNYLVAQGLDLNATISIDVEDYASRLDYTIEKGELELAQNLFDIGFRPGPLSAWHSNSLGALRFLSENGYDFASVEDVRDIGVGEAYLTSIFNRGGELTKYLLENGLKPSVNSLFLVDDEASLNLIIGQLQTDGYDWNQNVQLHNLLPFNMGFQITNLVPDLITTPLCAAANTKKTDVVRGLLAVGADPNAPDGYGRIPYFYAHFLNYKNIEDLLKPLTSAEWKLVELLKSISSEFTYHEEPWTELRFKKYFEHIPVSFQQVKTQPYGMDGDTGLLVRYEDRSIIFFSDNNPNQLVLLNPYAALLGEPVQSPVLFAGMPVQDALHRIGNFELIRDEISWGYGVFNQSADRFNFGLIVKSKDSPRVEQVMVNRTR